MAARSSRGAARHAAPRHAANGARARSTWARRMRAESPSPAEAPAAGPTGSSRQEPRRPHARSDRRRMPLAAKVALVCVALAALGFGAYVAWRHLAGARMARDEISAAIGDLSSSDEAIIPLNEAVSSPVGTYGADELAQISSDAEESVADLDSVEGRLETIRSLDEFLNDDDRAVVEALEESVSARRELVEHGTNLLDQEAALLTAQDCLDRSTEKALEADGHVEDSVAAAAQYALHLSGQESEVTDGNVPVGHDEAAAEAMSEAQDLLAQAKEAMPNADFSAYDDYYAKRAAAIAKLLEVDKAIASGDYAGGASLVEEYNALDAEAAQAAGALPQASSDVFEGAYDEVTGPIADGYAAAFDRAAEADERVRSYQGLSVEPSARA